MDIELLAQTAALRAAIPARRVEAQLRAVGKALDLSQTDQTTLLASYRLVWRLQAATRLLTDRKLDMAGLGEGAQAFLLRETGQNNTEALGQALDAAVRQAAQIIDGVFAGHNKTEATLGPDGS
jgi:glutamate-ammonia-ligase adenylyltransferase